MSAAITPLTPEVENFVRKASKGQNLGTTKACMIVFNAVGITAVKTGKVSEGDRFGNGSKVPEWTLSHPDMETLTMWSRGGDYLVRPRYCLPYNAEKSTKELAEKYGEFIITKCHELLGTTAKIIDGRPERSRDYRTDLTIRTCPVCFRDIKASSHTDHLMADHGFQIKGRDYGSWGYGGGHRQGSCYGTNVLPWEKSPEPAKPVLEGLLDFSAHLVKYLDSLMTGKVTSLKVKEGWGKNEKWLVVTPNDENTYKWSQAFDSEVFRTEQEIRSLWSGGFGSIPWYRMAIRTWQPVADDHIAVGAPSNPLTDSDNEGKVVLPKRKSSY